MDELIFIGRSDDNESLILATEEGQEFFVTIDAHLIRDVTNRPSTSEEVSRNEAAGITPREIQSRIRRGENVTEIAREAGVEESRIERYAGPVLSERAYMAGRARETYIRRSSEDELLEDAVLRQLSGINVDTLALEWDSFRREDGRWNVSVRWSVGAGDGIGNWIFDPMSQTVISIDNEARWLLEEDAAPTAKATEPERPRLVGVPAVDAPVRTIHAVHDEDSQIDPRAEELFDDVDPSDFVYDDATNSHVSSETNVSSESPDDYFRDDNADGSLDVPAWAGPGQPTMPVPAPLHAATSTPVDDSPSWDDILFGHRPSE